MNLTRRCFLRAGAAAMAPLGASGARAADYPQRPVRIVVGYPAGSGPDLMGRILASALSERLGQTFVIDNRPGAGSNLATDIVVKAPPDGYTLLVATTTNAINATLYPHLDFDFVRDIAPVGLFARSAFVLIVPPSLPVRTLDDFIAYAKAHRGEINMASQGVGTITHVAGELFKSMAGVEMTHVPYSGNPLPDVMSGRVQAFFSAIPAAVGNIKAGTVRALGVTTAARSEILPDVPAIGEVLRGYEATGWNGFGVPSGVRGDIAAALDAATRACLADEGVRKRIIDLGNTPVSSTAADFGRLMRDDTDKWGKVIRAGNIRLD